MVTIYHNPRCSKSRAALEKIQESGQTHEVVQYLKEVPTFEELKGIIAKLGIKPIELVRKGEQVFKDNFKGKELSDDEWIQAMVDFPKLIERPIVIVGEKAVVARPLEKIEEVI